MQAKNITKKMTLAITDRQLAPPFFYFKQLNIGSSPQSMGNASAMTILRCCRKVSCADWRTMAVRYLNEHADKIYHRGTEDTEFIGHRDSQTSAPDNRGVRLLAVDIWSSLNGSMQSLVFLPHTDHSIKSEIGASLISDLMEPPLLLFPPCLCGEFFPIYPQIPVRSLKNILNFSGVSI